MPSQKTPLLSTWLLIILLLSGCASIGTVQNQPNPAADPYESLNRNIYDFNINIFDRYFSKPISDAYRWITPRLVRNSVTNFFNNLDDINVLVNNMLQGKFRESGRDFTRIMVNSTWGLGGVFDLATVAGIERHDEDFAQTLAVWGVPSGPYLMVPALGPLTVRGVLGTALDAAFNPATYAGVLPAQFIRSINARANAENALRFIEESALDPYIFTRESFLQHRNYLIEDGKVEISGEDILGDDFFDDIE